MSRLARIKSLLEKFEIAPKRSLGQNFLVGDHVIEKIIDRTRKLQPTSIVEVGPGLGSITEDLLKLGGQFQVIEMDRVFAGYWRDNQVTVTEGDALKIDWQSLGLVGGSALVSNLPYQIGGRIVVERSLAPVEIDKMVLMFQKEVAQRIMSVPKTKDYGFLTIIAQAFWKIGIVVDAGPNQFYPPPNVTSRVLCFERVRSIDKENGDRFTEFVKGAFAQRRKLLFKNWSSQMGKCGVLKEDLIAWLQELGHGEKCRAEELSVSDYIELFSRFTKEDRFLKYGN